MTLALIVYVFIVYRKTPLNQTARWLHLLSLCVIPGFLLFLGNFVAYEESKEFSFCASCHPVMDPYVNDLVDPKSTTLASTHHQNRYIQEAQCYACHVGYGLNGTAEAKMNGLMHLYKFFTGTYTAPIKLYQPFKNANCLRCHMGAKKFQGNEVHAPLMSELTSEGMSCTDCHAPVHPDQTTS